MTTERYFGVLGTAAAALLATTAIGAWALWHVQHDVVVWVMLGEAVVYAGAAGFVWHSERHLDAVQAHRALLVILGVAVLARGLLILAPPVSTDINRYVWDGRVEAAGINPYRYRPADPQLAFLRDPAVFPNINRADTAITIYPPMAQVIFLAVTRIADNVSVMKAAMVGFEAAAVAVLLALLRRRELPATRILFYAWHPLPLFEFAGSGHIDAAAIALMLIACLLAERRHPFVAGAILGAAALVKFFPAVVAPGLYHRWDWRFPLGFSIAAVSLYLPFLGVGWQVLGFLPGYVQQEGLVSGGGFFLLNALGVVVHTPGWASIAYLSVGVALLTAIALTVLLRRDKPGVAIGAALVLLVTFTVLLSPHLAWYFTWVVPFLCFKPSWGLIYLSGAAPLLYELVWAPDALSLHAALYLPCAIILALQVYWDRRRSTPEIINDGSFGPRPAG